MWENKSCRDGEADMVTMARGLIADPDLPEKARQGDTEKIHHCIACNQGCFDEVFRLQQSLAWSIRWP